MVPLARLKGLVTPCRHNGVMTNGPDDPYEHAAQHHSLLRSGHDGTPRMPPRRIQTARRRGEIAPVHRGVWQFRAAASTWHGQALAACWAAGRRLGSGFGCRDDAGPSDTLAAISHESADFLWGLPGGPTSPIDVVCSRWDRTHHHGVRAHEFTDLAPSDITEREGVPVVVIELTLLQLAGRKGVSVSRVERAIHSARRRRLATDESIEAYLAQHARRGRPGVRKLRAAIELSRRQRRPAESDPEALLLQAARAHSLGEPALQFELRDADGRLVGRFDGAYESDRILFEYQSAEWHDHEAAGDRDSRRALRAAGLGWVVIEARWWDLQHGGAEFASAVRGIRARNARLRQSS